MALEFSLVDLKQEASTKERIYFGIILLLIFVAFARWLYIPKMKQIKIASVEIKNLSMQIDTLKKFAQLRLPEAASAQQQNVIRGNRFAAAVEGSTRPKQEMIAYIVGALTSQDVLKNVSLTGMSFAQEADGSGYIVMPMAIEVEGHYSSIIKYLERIEKMDRLVTADNIELTTVKDKSSIVQAKINVKIFVVKSAAETAATAAAAATSVQQPPAAQ